MVVNNDKTHQTLAQDCSFPDNTVASTTACLNTNTINAHTHTLYMHTSTTWSCQIRATRTKCTVHTHMDTPASTSATKLLRHSGQSVLHFTPTHAYRTDTHTHTHVHKPVSLSAQLARLTGSVSLESEVGGVSRERGIMLCIVCSMFDLAFGWWRGGLLRLVFNYSLIPRL